MSNWTALSLWITPVAAMAMVDVSPQIAMVDLLFGQKTPISTAQARNVASLGFKLVRLPVVDLSNETLIYDSIENLRGAGLCVVLDLHPFEGSQRLQNSSEFFTLPAQWNRIAQRFRGRHLNELAFELINEPDYRKGNIRVYDSWLTVTIAAVRSVDPQRWIVVSNPAMGDSDYFDGPLLKWTPPREPRIIATMHFYRPFEITHPVSYLTKNRGARNYPYPPKRGQNTDYQFKDFNFFDQHFARFVRWSRKHNVTPWIGEAGCHHETPGQVQWLADTAAKGRKYKVPICWWSLGGFALRAKWDGNQYTPIDPKILGIITRT